MSTRRDANMQPTSAVENPIHRSLVWTAWMLLTHFVAAMAVIAVLMTVVPRFVRMFANLDVDVPPVTEVVIGLSHVAAGYWYVVLPLGLAVDAVVLFGLSRLPAGERWLGTVWASVVWMAALGLMALVTVALVVPLEGLITALS
jgi:type II secretory pathway component PulF